MLILCIICIIILTEYFDSKYGNTGRANSEQSMSLDYEEANL